MYNNKKRGGVAATDGGGGLAVISQYPPQPVENSAQARLLTEIFHLRVKYSFSPE